MEEILFMIGTVDLRHLKDTINSGDDVAFFGRNLDKIMLTNYKKL